MQVSKIINHIKHGDLSNLGVVKNLNGTNTTEVAKAEEQILSYINLGILELNKRFNISVEAEIVKTNPIVNVYSLRNDNIAKIINVYDPSGYELRFPSVVNVDDYDIKEIGYLTFMMKEPRDEELAFVYNAVPDEAVSVDDEVKLPSVMLEALLNYVGQRAYSSVGGNRQQDHTLYVNKFEQSCKVLEDHGYFKGNDLMSKNVLEKGFV